MRPAVPHTEWAQFGATAEVARRSYSGRDLWDPKTLEVRMEKKEGLDNGEKSAKRTFLHE